MNDNLIKTVTNILYLKTATLAGMPHHAIPDMIELACIAAEIVCIAGGGGATFFGTECSLSSVATGSWRAGTANQTEFFLASSGKQTSCVDAH